MASLHDTLFLVKVESDKNRTTGLVQFFVSHPMYGEGISKTGELLDLGVKAGVVEKSGAWFSYNSERLGQGRENAKVFLKENPDVADEIESLIRENFGAVNKAVSDSPDASDTSDASDDNVDSDAIEKEAA